MQIGQGQLHRLIHHSGRLQPVRIRVDLRLVKVPAGKKLVLRHREAVDGSDIEHAHGLCILASLKGRRVIREWDVGVLAPKRASPIPPTPGTEASRALQISHLAPPACPHPRRLQRKIAEPRSFVAITRQPGGGGRSKSLVNSGAYRWAVLRKSPQVCGRGVGPGHAGEYRTTITGQIARRGLKGTDDR